MRTDEIPKEMYQSMSKDNTGQFLYDLQINKCIKNLNVWLNEEMKLSCCSVVLFPMLHIKKLVVYLMTLNGIKHSHRVL